MEEFDKLQETYISDKRYTKKRWVKAHYMGMDNIQEKNFDLNQINSKLSFEKIEQENLSEEQIKETSNKILNIFQYFNLNFGWGCCQFFDTHQEHMDYLTKQNQIILVKYDEKILVLEYEYAEDTYYVIVYTLNDWHFICKDSTEYRSEYDDDENMYKYHYLNEYTGDIICDQIGEDYDYSSYGSCPSYEYSYVNTNLYYNYDCQNQDSDSCDISDDTFCYGSNCLLVYCKVLECSQYTILYQMATSIAYKTL
ncbi:hypothetical protein PPERSA_07414 [Pseudocohnilembus persalinus]|uniref:Uncharacterized protein n=1 Tax=Pseudocohnilembus persalinus TaxID=266149 RepID=A0A0V0QAC4_PSEPJ|nr:hypothetical protein PPERSA_07414 [Pseudocohnilembus persalinus]|eukprot:KRW99171.1 hypothetical protein PPERSA_07414 [Pseudocohnilembus persalinus]